MWQIVLQVLEDIGKPLILDQLVCAIFDTQSNAELERAKEPLASQLRLGVKDGRWRKLPSGSYGLLTPSKSKG